MTIWPQPDGAPIACNEKLKVLAENESELRSVMSDAFDDAVLMGVDPAAMRALLVEMVQTLPGPGSIPLAPSRTGPTGNHDKDPDKDAPGTARPDGGRA